MKLRVQKVSFMEVSGLGIGACLKIYFYMFYRFLNKDIHDGNGLVIIRDKAGGYQGFISPNALKKARGVLKKAIRKNRIIQSDITQKELEDFWREEKETPKYCPLFEKEKFLGLAYFNFELDVLAEELEIVLKHCEWGADFWQDKILLTGEEEDITEKFWEINKIFLVPMITDIKELKNYKGKYVISQKSFRIINEYVRKMDLQNCLNGLEKVDIPVIVGRIPLVNEIGKLTEDEQLRNKLLISGAYVENPDQIIVEQLKKVYGKDYSLWEKGEIACIRQYYAYEQGIYKLVDRKGEGTNVVDGKRVTVGIPDEWQNSIYIIGPCTVQGSYVKDNDTIPSYIQEYLNQCYPHKYRVVNLGSSGFYEGDIENISKLTLKKADIVIFVNCFQTNEISIPCNMKYIDFAKCFFEREGECFFDSPKHVNAEGSRKLAETIWEDALKNIIDEFEDTYGEEKERGCIVKKADYFYGMSKEIEQVVKALQRNKFSGISNNIGAIVMNCNPFTLGHKYLIETASRQVDYLYVFIVEEDKSYFCFQDRLNMVKNGVSDLENVCVLPSGKYILSANTMPEYFTKESRQDIVICASDDLEIFGMYVAPILGITKRFVGEEPFDKITKQYNEAMKRILPEYGVELICIERKRDGENNAISASKVRELLSKKQYKEVEKLVPESTFSYLEGAFI